MRADLSACKSLIARLVCRGDHLAIYQGRLEIIPASGKAVPEDWLTKHRDQIIREILELIRQEGCIYTSYTTGNYQVRQNIRSDGVTLNFINPVTGQDLYAIFNANLKRERSTKHGRKGDRLPTGHFRIGRKHGLYKFWIQTGLPIPKRLAALHDYMGHLKNLVYSCTVKADNPNKQGRIDTSKGIPPLTITAEQIRQCMNSYQSQPYNPRTTSGQSSHNSRTTLPDNELTTTSDISELEQNQATGINSYDKRLQGNTNMRELSPSLTLHQQTADEWLTEYDSR